MPRPMLHAVIMAGGVGTRFWPQSRRQRPKQFLNVFGDATLIQNTVARLQGLVPPERCLVVTHERYAEQTRQQLPAVPAENVLTEPIARNTAPCIAYAAAVLLARDPDATMIVLPADHVITNVQAFHRALEVAVEAAQRPGALVTIGIQPTHPSTGFGYVQADGEPLLTEPQAYPVRTFAEKPDLPTAERFLESGDFLWNSGMFIWRADAIWHAFEQHLPDAYEAFAPVRDAVGTDEERAAVATAYEESPRISIDYGVMERADRVFVVPGAFGWNDVGDWRAVFDLSEKNEHGSALHGEVIVHDSSRCYVQAGDRLVVLVGIHDTIVVDAEDALLVCNRENTQQVKNVVEYLDSRRLEQYL